MDIDCDSPNFSSVPAEYHNQAEAFSKCRVLAPPYPYDCAINLLQSSPMPMGQVYSLSGPERESMEKYIHESVRETALTCYASTTRVLTASQCKKIFSYPHQFSFWAATRRARFFFFYLTPTILSKFIRAMSGKRPSTLILSILSCFPDSPMPQLFFRR